jgi:hypothetical protein
MFNVERTMEMQYGADSATNGTSPLAADLQGGYHLESFEEFLEHLNQAAKPAPNTISRRYRDVFVLLLRWQDDDLGTESEIQDLECLFRETYRYRTKRYLIPSSDSATQLEYKLNDFRKPTIMSITS